MKTQPPIDLAVKTMTCKVSADAQDRLKAISKRHGLKLQDVHSACLLYMPEDEIVRIVQEQQAALDQLPSALKSMLRNIDKLSDADRAMLRDMLS